MSNTTPKNTSATLLTPDIEKAMAEGEIHTVPLTTAEFELMLKAIRVYRHSLESGGPFESEMEEYEKLKTFQARMQFVRG